MNIKATGTTIELRSSSSILDGQTTRSIIIAGETITEDMVASMATEAEWMDAQPGPLGLALGEKPTHGPKMIQTGIVWTTLHLRDGRTLKTILPKD